MNWPIRRLSFRTRLTLRWTGAVAVLLALVNIVVYVGASTYSRRDLDAQVQTLAANDLLSAAEVTSQGHLFENPGSAFHDFGFMPAYGQLLTLDGRVANSTPSLAAAAAPARPAARARGRRGQPAHRDVRRQRTAAAPAGRPGPTRRPALRARRGGLGSPDAAQAAAPGVPAGRRLDRRRGGDRAARLRPRVPGPAPIDHITRRATAIARGDFTARLDPPSWTTRSAA